MYSALPVKWVAFEMAGRMNYPNWVTSYKIRYSRDGLKWIWADNETIYTGVTCAMCRKT